MQVWRLLACVLVVLQPAWAGRILGVFPCPSISHQIVFRALTLELASRGHELVVITTDPMPKPHPNITEIDIHEVAYGQFRKVIHNFSYREKSLLDQYPDQQIMFIEMFEVALNAPQVRAIIADEKQKFDLILVELLVRPLHSLRHRFRAPVIGVSSFSSLAVTFDAIGVPTHPILYPDFFIDKWTNIGLLDRVNMLYAYLRQKTVDFSVVPKINEATRKYLGADTPCITELEAQMDMTFLNANPVWDGPRPVPPSVVYFGGTHMSPPKPLPQELQSLLDDASEGVVYMSLGSNVQSSMLSAEVVRMFLEVFSRLQYRVLWKWEQDQLPGKPDNVHIQKWFPQPDILRHPNVKAFITQGGLQSLDEALQAGVPLIGLPFFGDQDYNVAKFQQHGVGKALRLSTLTADELDTAIREVAGDQRYSAAMHRMGALLADQPSSGLERAAWWSEHVMRHGGAPHLRSPAANVSSFTYFMLDIVALIAFAMIALAISATLLIRALCNAFKKIKEKKH